MNPRPTGLPDFLCACVLMALTMFIVGCAL